MVLSIILVIVSVTTIINLILLKNKIKYLETSLLNLNRDNFILIKENTKLKDKVKILETPVVSEKEKTVKLENNISKEETKNNKKQNKNNKK